MSNVLVCIFLCLPKKYISQEKAQEEQNRVVKILSWALLISAQLQSKMCRHLTLCFSLSYIFCLGLILKLM